MNVSVAATRREEVPVCFAKEWDKNAPECAGGPDPDFVHPITKLHVHEQCNFFTSCGSRQEATKRAQLIPPSSLFRGPGGAPWQPQAPAAATYAGPPQTFADFLRRQASDAAEVQRQAAMTGQRPPAAPFQPGVQPQYMHQQVQQGYVHRPATNYQLNYEMPPYLSAPEDRHPGEGLMPVLFREIVRSMFKALGHAIAHFFDARQMKMKE